MGGTQRTGVAIAGRDGALLLHTPGFVTLLALPTDITAPERRLDDILAELRATHPDIDKLPDGRMRCRISPERIIEIAFERIPYERLCVSVTDISDQRAIETELRGARAAAEAASQSKSRFLATMSHELRTPLNAVIGFSDLLLREATAAGDIEIDRARAAEFAGAIHQAGHSLLGLINSILDVARIESGRFELAADLIDLPHMMQSCVRAAEHEQQGTEITLDTPLRSGMPRLRGDERRLRQVISHLLTNAMKFSRPPSKVAVSTEIGMDRDLLIRVADTGIGIAPENLERVFEPFQQVESGLSRRVSGAGIGLYLCRALVQAHGGELTLASRPGEGTTAMIRLPHTRLITAPASLELLQEAP